jgi:hypothetical protein
MRIAFLCGVVVAVLLVGGPVRAQQSLVPYDNFTDKILSVDNWYGGQGVDSGVTMLEIDRERKGAKLLMANRGYANIASHSGTSGSQTALFFANGGPITTIQAQVKVSQIDVGVCSNNSDGEGQARIGGDFFNTVGGTAGSGDSTNDVFAQIGVRRKANTTDPSKVLEVYGKVTVCANADCSLSDTYYETADGELGTVKVNKPVTLQITWDDANNQFIFQQGTNPKKSMVTSYIYTSILSNNGDPGTLHGGAKRLQVRNSMANCSDSPRLMGYVQASFDNVYVNPEAVP